MATVVLAKRGVKATIPQMEEFPYVIRAVSDLRVNNGSSSMASVCGSSLKALMDNRDHRSCAGGGYCHGPDPRERAICGPERHLGDEDHLGDMVQGSPVRVTALPLQMDIKINGITREIMEKALEQARVAACSSSARWKKVIAEPRMSDFVRQCAPRYVTMKINPEKIRRSDRQRW
ncbi:MAG: hypothetical protein R3E89_05700 [Thiolinea sp.]